MKGYLLFLILSIFGLPYHGKSQTFNFHNTSDILTHANSIKMSVYSTGIIQNLSATDSLTLDIIRLQNDHSPPWRSSICTDLCYSYHTDSTELVLAPGQSQLFKNYFAFFQHTADTAHTRILFSDHLNPGNYFIRDYYCVDDSASFYFDTPQAELSSRLEIYPNPFSSETLLKFGKPLNNATLRMYNTSGQKVKEILNIHGQALKLNGDNLPHGLYFIQLTEGNMTVTKKVTLTGL